MVPNENCPHTVLCILWPVPFLPPQVTVSLLCNSPVFTYADRKKKFFFFFSQSYPRVSFWMCFSAAYCFHLGFCNPWSRMNCTCLPLIFHITEYSITSCRHVIFIIHTYVCRNVLMYLSFPWLLVSCGQGSCYIHLKSWGPSQMFGTY